MPVPDAGKLPVTRVGPTTLVLLLVVSALSFVIACGSDGDAAAGGQAIATPAPTAAPALAPTDTPGPATPPSNSSLDSGDREAYVNAADTAVRLIRQSALALSQIGITLSGAVEFPPGTRETVTAAENAMKLALEAIKEIPAPEGFGALRESIITSATFYIASAQVILNHPDGAPFDFFEFQEPFETGGDNFHKTSALLGDARAAK